MRRRKSKSIKNKLKDGVSPQVGEIWYNVPTNLYIKIIELGALTFDGQVYLASTFHKPAKKVEVLGRQLRPVSKEKLIKIMFGQFHLNNLDKNGEV